MADVLPALIRTGAVALGSTIAGVGYASVVERNAFVLREITMPVLTPGSTPLRVLHLSDLHMLPVQRRKQAWLRELAGWEPDLVVNTGDNLAHPKAVPAVVQGLGDLLCVRVRQQRLLRAPVEEPVELRDQAVAPGPG
jgi:predicted MPP superfamily phosphohydrolase